MSAAGQLPAEGPPPASAASRAPRSLDLKIVAGLFALALAARLAAAVVMPQRANDAERYVAQAGNLLDHRAFSSSPDGSKPTMADMPGFAAVLAVFVAALGEGALALRLPGVIFGAAAAPLAFLLAASLVSDRRIAAAAGAATAVLPSLVGSATMVLTESLYSGVLTAAVLLYVRLWQGMRRDGVAGKPEDGPSPGPMILPAAAAGAVLAAAALVRPVAGAFAVPGALGVLAVSCRRGAGPKRGVLLGGAFLAAFAIAMAPWTARNYAASGRLVPFTTRGPGMLWLGSNPGTGGRYTDEALAELGERSRRMSPDEIRDEALRRMGSRPVGWAVSGARRAVTVWLGLPGGKRLLAGRPFLASVVWPPDLAAVALAAAALVLAALGRTRSGAGAIGLYLACESSVYFVLVGLARFRVPMMPVVLVLAAIAIDAALRWRAAATPADRGPADGAAGDEAAPGAPD